MWGVIQCGDSARFTLELIARLHICGHRRRDHLDSDGAVRTRVARLVHFAHPAGADPRRELIRPDAAPIEIRGARGVEP